MPDFKSKARFAGASCIRQTDAAILVEIDGRQHWIPRSQIDDDSEVFEEGHEGKLAVSQWIAEQKGLV